MAEKLAELRQKGGGGVPVASGTFSRSTSPVTINCGFRPKKIFIIHGSGSSTTSANGESQVVYDSDWSTTLVALNYRAANGTAYMQKQGISTYFTLSDTGFTIEGTTTTYAGTYYYTAIGE